MRKIITSSGDMYIYDYARFDLLIYSCRTRNAFLKRLKESGMDAALNNLHGFREEQINEIKGLFMKIK